MKTVFKFWFQVITKFYSIWPTDKIVYPTWTIYSNLRTKAILTIGQNCQSNSVNYWAMVVLAVPTIASKHVHVNLFEGVGYKGVDLWQQSHRED